MKQWLEDSLSLCTLSDRAQGYLLGRGALQDSLSAWGIVVWECPFDPCPDEDHREKYGPFFEALEGSLAIPIRSATGNLLGVEFRAIETKKINRLALPESKWNPMWIGMPQAMPLIWEGSPIYIVEGVFDVFALQRILGKGAVLGSGPAHMSFRQLSFIRRWALDTVYVVYDRDAAGKKGTEDAVQTLSKWGVDIKELPYGKPGDDPGVIWDRGGTAALREAFPYI